MVCLSPWECSCHGWVFAKRFFFTKQNILPFGFCHVMREETMLVYILRGAQNWVVCGETVWVNAWEQNFVPVQLWCPVKGVFHPDWMFLELHYFVCFDFSHTCSIAAERVNNNYICLYIFWLMLMRIHLAFVLFWLIKLVGSLPHSNVREKVEGFLLLSRNFQIHPTPHVLNTASCWFELLSISIQ